MPHRICIGLCFQVIWPKTYAQKSGRGTHWNVDDDGLGKGLVLVQKRVRMRGNGFGGSANGSGNGRELANRVCCLFSGKEQAMEKIQK